ncbi:hypothetical protein H9P43_005746 [Blastocladiella emersonii ATCC 22665]|nr:hypothetical protein H9P43_005746 [Blastocladiella emersonii ATCC 22665]
MAITTSSASSSSSATNHPPSPAVATNGNGNGSAMMHKRRARTATVTPPPPPPADSGSEFELDDEDDADLVDPARAASDYHSHSHGSAGSDSDDDALQSDPETPAAAVRWSNNSVLGTTLRPWMKPRPEGVTYTFLRWPLIVAIGVTLVAELVLYFLVRQCVAVYESCVVWTGRAGAFRKQLLASTTYEAWCDAAVALDNHFGRQAWREIAASPIYDYRLIRSITAKLRRFRRGAGSVAPAAPEFGEDTAPAPAPPASLPKLRDLCLESACKANIGGVETRHLYSHCLVGTKSLIDEYVHETVSALDSLAAAPVDPADPAHAWESARAKRVFFARAAQLYGRTALCLSGGASFAYYHLGVIRSLLDADLLPRVITGTSAGSLIAAIVCTRTDAELHNELEPGIHVHLTACDDPWSVRLRRLWTDGVLFSAARWQSKMGWVTGGDLTFLEAYRRTGRVLNVSVVTAGRNTRPKLLNYRTSPNVVIWSAVMASSAVPGVIEPVQLMIKRVNRAGDVVIEPFTGWGDKWQDGSLRTDIPTRSLHQLFNVTYTIVSQVNPHVFPFHFEPTGGSGNPTAHRGGRGWRGGFVLTALEHLIKLDLKKWLKMLRDLRLLPPMLDQDWSFIWLQNFGGNVNILPQLALIDCVHILSDPDEYRMTRFLRLGQRNTWGKLAEIKNRLLIEQKFESVRAQLAADLRAAGIADTADTSGPESTANDLSPPQSP